MKIECPGCAQPIEIEAPEESSRLAGRIRRLRTNAASFILLAWLALGLAAFLLLLALAASFFIGHADWFFVAGLAFGVLALVFYALAQIVYLRANLEKD